ncbi:hypothetical protein Patl1_14527 [Pistacia atlantica]|uniref:Uncharacterized protein n=1 Tax=Pistacia atlantica TaxID=434234 RepID=A0ACC1AVQ6_9ROSI|nr:hypothetical protein Patl1_14527 [Pistacia atlantica]
MPLIVGSMTFFAADFSDKKGGEEQAIPINDDVLQAYYGKVHSILKVTKLDFAFLIAVGEFLWHYVSEFMKLSYEDQVEQLRASVDFSVELCDTVSPAKEGNFANWSHQTLDFILGEVLT